MTDAVDTPNYPDLVRHVARAIAKVEAPGHDPDAIFPSADHPKAMARWEWHSRAAEAAIRAFADYLKQRQESAEAEG